MYNDVDWDEIYSKIHWGDIINEGEGSVFVINVDSPHLFNSKEGLKKGSFKFTDKYLEYQYNKYNYTGTVIVYDILDKVIDEKDNLIVFIKRKSAVEFGR